MIPAQDILCFSFFFFRLRTFFCLSFIFIHVTAGTIATAKFKREFLSKTTETHLDLPLIKTHGSVSCGPRSRRATREYINRKKENAIFTPMQLSDPLPDWNQIC